MLTKSRKSAAVMAAVALVAALAVYLVGQDLVASPSLLDALFRPGLFSAGEMAVGGALLLIVLALGVGIGTFLIYPLDESHFGLMAAARWLVVGLLLGLALHGLALLLPASAGSSVRDYALGRVLRLVLAPVVAYLAYWLVFRLPPRLGKRNRRGG